MQGHTNKELVITHQLQICNTKRQALKERFLYLLVLLLGLPHSNNILKTRLSSSSGNSCPLVSLQQTRITLFFACSSPTGGQFAMAGKVNDEVTHLWPENLHLQLKTLDIRKTLLTFDYRQLIQIFFFIILKYLFPVRVQSLEGLIWTNGKNHWDATFREQWLVQRSHTTCTTSSSNTQISAWVHRARWLSFLHPYPLQWQSRIMSSFCQCPCLDPVLSLTSYSSQSKSHQRQIKEAGGKCPTKSVSYHHYWPQKATKLFSVTFISCRVYAIPNPTRRTYILHPKFLNRLIDTIQTLETE